jgi:hypothetical protein
MKITEILIENQIQEGPLLNKIGRGIGKAVGAAAKGVGAVAGGVAGLGRAVKKGFQAGKTTVGGAGDDETDTQPAAGTGTAPAAPSAAPAQQTLAPAAKKTTAPATKPAAVAKTAAPKTSFGKLSAAAAGAPAEPATTPKNDTAYAQVQKAISSLDAKQKQNIIALLQKQVGNAPAAKAAPAQPAAKPAAKAAAPATGAEPVIKGKKKVAKKPAGPSQAEIDADRARIMGVTSDSVIRKQPALSESFSLFRKQ